MSQLKLPELGEGIDVVDVSAVLVAVGDFVRRDQPVIEVETEKASLEVPAAVDGEILKLLVKTGDQLKVGQVILEVGPAASTEQAVEPVVVETPTPESEPAPTLAVAAPAEVVPFPAAPQEAAPPVERFVPVDPAAIGPTAPAAPSARALARELGVDIQQVVGRGPGGRISRDDVKAHAKRLVQGAAIGGAPLEPQLPDFTQWGPVRREPLTNVRRATARGMATAWSTVPHVTQFDDSDITQLDSMRKRFNQRPEAADRKLTMTAIVIKMVGSVLRQFPKFNASLDLAGEAIVYKDYVHVGCAVDTDRGLLVPVLQDVDKKSLVQVAVELNDLAKRARAKKLKPAEMRGAGFTVSNLGGLGTTHFSPIVNWPEVAILGVGRAEQRAVFEEGQFRPRLIMPLSVSYDHRLIDGADAARFLRRVAEALEQPLLLLLDD